MVDVVCPNCGKKLKIHEKYLGYSGKCNYCGGHIEVSPSAMTSGKDLDQQSGEGVDKLQNEMKSLKAPSIKIFVTVVLILFLTIAIAAALYHHVHPPKLVSSQGSSEKGVLTHVKKQKTNSESKKDKSQGVTCDIFEAVVEIQGDTVSFRLNTDLPDTADVKVTVSRTYFTKEEPGVAYSRDYFNDIKKVAYWRKETTCPVGDNIYEKSVQEQLNMMTSIGEAFTVESINNEIEISFVLPIGQSDPSFGERNESLRGKMVPATGLKSIRFDKKLEKPLRQGSSKIPESTTAYYATLEIGKSYKLSRETPVMPEFESKDPLLDISRMFKVPASSTILIKEIRTKKISGTDSPWYRVEAFGLNRELLGEGWINSIALMGQDLITKHGGY